MDQAKEIVKTATELEYCEAELELQKAITALEAQKNSEHQKQIEFLNKSLKKLRRKQKGLSVGLGSSLGATGVAVLGLVIYVSVK